MLVALIVSVMETDVSCGFDSGFGIVWFNVNGWSNDYAICIWDNKTSLKLVWLVSVSSEAVPASDLL